jgi:TolB-like protein
LSGPDIFLSYNREDQAVAKRFAEGFEAAGLSVWWDATLRSGDTYDEVTEAALRGAKAVVVLWSPRSVISHWVRAEATIAHRAKTLVPAIIEPCDKPVMFELTQTADLAHWRGDAIDPAWQAFLADVAQMAQRAGRDFVNVATARTSAESNAESGVPQVASVSPIKSGQGRPLLAVLPFLDRSGLPLGEQMAEQLVEDLAAALSDNPWVEVIAASATMSYRNAVRDLRQIGQDLGARYVLEGNVRRAADDVRVTAQLIGAETGKVLWTHKFNQAAAEGTACLEGLAAEVTAKLGVQILGLEVDRAVRKQGPGTAWEAYMRAVAHYNRATRAGYEAAVAEARRVLEIDPNAYDFAYGPLLVCQGMLMAYRGDDPDFERGLLETIRTARARDPDSPSVLTGCCGAFSGMRKPLDALPFAERGVAKFPNLDWSRACYGIVLLQLGRSDEGLAELQISDRLAPSTVTNHSDMVWPSVGYLQIGRLDEALEAAHRAVRLLVSPESLIQLVLCLAMTNDWPGAREAMRRLRETDPGIERAHIQNLVRFFHCGSAGVTEFVEIAGRLWDEKMGVESQP